MKNIAPLLWFKFKDIKSKEWSVYFSSIDLHEDLYEDYNLYLGLCYRDKNTIVLNASFPQPVLNETLFHEILHASCNPKSLMSDFDEEEAIKSFEKRLTHILLNGLGLVLPPLPEGLKELVKHAKSQERRLKIKH